MQKRKEVKSKESINNTRTVRQNYDVDSNISNQKLLLDFSIIDKGHNLWGFKNLKTVDSFSDLLNKLSNYCSMTWNEILRASGGKKEGNGNNNHFCKMDGFCKDAKERLEELKQECDELFSLRLQSNIRLYGIRDRSIFKPIWYDAYHGKEDKEAYITKH